MQDYSKQMYIIISPVSDRPIYNQERSKLETKATVLQMTYRAFEIRVL